MTKPKRRAVREERVFVTPRRTLTADALEEIAGTLGVKKPEILGKLKTNLETCAGFLDAMRIADNGPSEALAREEVRAVRSKCVKLDEALTGLSPGTLDLLQHSFEFRDTTLAGWVRGARREISLISLGLRWAQEDTLAGETRGRRESKAMRSQVFAFANVFNAFYAAPKRASWARESREGRGRPKNVRLDKAIEFLAQCFNAFYPPKDRPSEKWLRTYKPLREKLSDCN